jgi:hypothetical protein
MVFVMAHKDFPWSLCRKDHGNWVPLVSQHDHTLVDTGPIGVQEVQCDLSRHLKTPTTGK